MKQILRKTLISRVIRYDLLPKDWQMNLYIKDLFYVHLYYFSFFVILFRYITMYPDSTRQKGVSTVLKKKGGVHGFSVNPNITFNF